MRLLRLKASHLRNLQDLDLRPSTGITLFQGPNASGKSSLLEGIHVLSCGKSFRTQHLAQAIRHGEERMIVTGELSDVSAGTISIGIETERGQGRTRMRAGGRPIQKVSELAALMPVVAVHQESHRVFTEGPHYRRQFLDWGLFHVEQTFLPAWQRYRRAIKQRNVLLQHSGAGAEAWDAELATSGTVIDRLRRRYLALFMPHFQQMTDLLQIPERIEAVYRPGWEEGAELAGVLKQAFQGDRAIGYTRYGPHRADIVFTRERRPAKEDLSRGQLKTLVCALYLAQAAAFTEATGRQVLLLMDDLTAELDERHSRRLLERIHNMDLQAFITSSEPRVAASLAGEGHKVFHVEHGGVTEVL